MFEKNNNLSEYNAETLANAESMSFGIVVSQWNIEVTEALKEGAVNILLKQNANINNIHIEYVPGSFEIPLAAQLMLEHLELDAVICLGCTIQGETPHFNYICQGVTHAISKLNQNYSRPVIFGVLTTNDMQQAIDRAGGKHGNKGVEAAVAAIKMVDLSRRISGN